MDSKTYRSWEEVPEFLRQKIEADAKVPGMLEFFGQVKEFRSTYDLDEVADKLQTENWAVLDVCRKMYLHVDGGIGKRYEFVLGRFR